MGREGVVRPALLTPVSLSICVSIHLSLRPRLTGLSLLRSRLQRKA